MRRVLWFSGVAGAQLVGIALLIVLLGVVVDVINSNDDPDRRTISELGENERGSTFQIGKTQLLAKSH